LLSCSREQLEQKDVNVWTKDMRYFKDTRTNCCFVKVIPYSLTYVPCEKVPEEMLYIADVNEK